MKNKKTIPRIRKRTDDGYHPHPDQIRGWVTKPNQTFQPKLEKKAVVIFSGGVDSTTLLYGLIRDGYKIHALTFDYGQRFKREIEVSKEIIKMATTKKNPIVHKIINISDLNKIYESVPLIGQKKIKFPTVKASDVNNMQDDATKRAFDSMKFSEIPFRNAIFLSIAVAYAQSIGFNGVWYAAHRSMLGTVFPDCTDNFVDAMEITSRHGTGNDEMRIFAPFLNYFKSDIIGYCSDKINSRKFKVPLEKTYSCYSGTKLNCGICNNCVPRIEAFKRSGVKDLTLYENQKNVRVKSPLLVKNVKSGTKSRKVKATAK